MAGTQIPRARLAGESLQTLTSTLETPEDAELFLASVHFGLEIPESWLKIWGGLLAAMRLTQACLPDPHESLDGLHPKVELCLLSRKFLYFGHLTP